ncbi:MAG: TusE/DsrC/DsvC family sulfur relay protein [Psittacicella sp.]
MFNLTEDGYLLNQNDWNKDFAKFSAKNDNLELTDEHWELINFIRDFYLKYNTTPGIRILVGVVKKEFGIEKGNSTYLQKLFPKGPALQLSKFAGLPKPAKCL